jgi:hypothetical protein
MLWPFGAGFSLTEFDMNCSHSSTDGNHSFVCTVHNTGSRAGDEIIMVFQRPMANVRAKAVSCH